MHVQHVHTSGEVKDSHLGQEEERGERGGFKPTVEFGIHSSGTCGCSAAQSITWQAVNPVKPQCCCQQLQCRKGRVIGAMSTAEGLF